MRRLPAPAVIAASLLVFAGCASYEPLTPPETTLSRDVSLTDRGDYLAIAPVDSGNETYEHGIIFYPGGLVEPEAYVSLLAPLAERGVPVAIVRVPFNLAVFGSDAAAIVLDDRFGDLAETWTLAGHSLGGAMAARFMARRSWDYESARGLILLAAYPADSDPLRRYDIEVLSIWASNDGLATAEDREETRALLPEDTRYHVIEGGNHAGFGEYGPQDNDGELEISRAEQHRTVRELIVGFLNEL
ncbi:MAG: alpha/beta hydrolase [Spirochaetota bacterium]